jgi:hypothetical protein
MTLLAPLAGLLAGAIGLGVLLALHALKLRRRPVRISSTLLWRDAARDLEVNIPWKAPRPTLLFLLQALAVLLLALAIARPVLGGADRVPGRLIVVLDASASMGATDADPQGRTRLDRAKALAASRLGELRRSTGVPEIAVVRAALEPRMVVAPTRSVDAALAGVRSVEPTDQPLDPDALKTMLGALRDGAQGEESETVEEPTLWVFTDAGDLTPRDLAGWSGEIIAAGPDTPGANAGIVALHATRDPTDPTTARVFFRLVSNAARPVGVVVRITADGVTTPVPLEIPASTEEGPGAVTRTVAVSAPGRQRIEVALDRDAPAGALAADDRAWADLPDPRPPRTVVFAPDARPDPFLMDVLGVLAPGAVSVHAPSDADAPRGAELIVYDRVTPPRTPPAPSLGFGSGWPSRDARPDGPDADLGAVADTGRQRVIAWDRAHPVLRDLTLSPVVFDRAVPLPDATEPGVAVLAEARTGPVMIEGVAGGHRHIRVAFPLNRSNWSVDVGMPIFVAAAFERLAPGVRGEGVVRTTAEPIELRTDADRVTAIGPEPQPAQIAAPAADGVAVLGPLPRVGLYGLTGAEQPDVGVALLDAGESAIPTRPGAVFGRAASPNTGPGAPTEGRRELWPELLLAAFIVITLEWLVHARRARI